MGIVEPQRHILKKDLPSVPRDGAPRFGKLLLRWGSGFAIINSMNFKEWRENISSRMKLKQILEAFKDVLDPGIKKYVCAPCSNCKGAIRDILSSKDYGRNRASITEPCELVHNAMVDMKKPFIEWEWH